MECDCPGILIAEIRVSESARAVSGHPSATDAPPPIAGGSAPPGRFRRAGAASGSGSRGAPAAAHPSPSSVPQGPAAACALRGALHRWPRAAERPGNPEGGFGKPNQAIEILWNARIKEDSPVLTS